MRYKCPWTESPHFRPNLVDGRGSYLERLGQPHQGTAQGHRPHARGACLGGKRRSFLLRCGRTGGAQCHLHRTLPPLHRPAMRCSQIDAQSTAPGLTLHGAATLGYQRCWLLRDLTSRPYRLALLVASTGIWSHSGISSSIYRHQSTKNAIQISE